MYHVYGKGSKAFIFGIETIYQLPSHAANGKLSLKSKFLFRDVNYSCDTCTVKFV